MNQKKQPSPELFLNAVMAYRDSAAVKGAVELDVFSALAQGVNTAQDLAERCRADKRGMRILCDYLCVMGLLEKSGSTYSLTQDSAVFLDRNSPAYMGDVVNFLLARISFHMLRQTPAGDTCTAAEYEEIFAAAGLEMTACAPLTGTAYTVIVAGHK